MQKQCKRRALEVIESNNLRKSKSGASAPSLKLWLMVDCPRTGPRANPARARSWRIMLTEIEARRRGARARATISATNFSTCCGFTSTVVAIVCAACCGSIRARIEASLQCQIYLYAQERVLERHRDWNRARPWAALHPGCTAVLVHRPCIAS